MERKTWPVAEFASGTNELPQGYFWNVVSGSHGPVVQISLSERYGTRAEDPRCPDAPILYVPTKWNDLIRLALQISDMAQATGTRLPDGVLVRVTH